ncbi:protein LEG1 homolog [Erethizon dorsatum]
MWSLLVTPTFLSLSCFSVGLAPNPGSATDVNDGYPPFWDQIHGDMAEFPVKDNKRIIDVWNYLDRLKMYKILITKTNKYFVQFGQNDTGNVLWALTLFFGKLYKTGRYSDPSNISVCAYEAGSPGCISIDSGWGGINFYVIIMNFLGAIECGFLKDASHEIELLGSEEHRSDFCYSIEECRASYPQAMDAATRFYQYLLSRKVSSLVSDVPVYDTEKDTAITYMWAAHQAAIDVAKPKFKYVFSAGAAFFLIIFGGSFVDFMDAEPMDTQARLYMAVFEILLWKILRLREVNNIEIRHGSQHFSKTERDFTKDFLCAIEFCEAAKYRPYFESAAQFIAGFPHKLLTNQDDPFSTRDFSTREKAQLSTVKLISNMNKITDESTMSQVHLECQQGDQSRSDQSGGPFRGSWECVPFGS